MEGRTMKRKASFTEGPPNKRRRLQYSDGTERKPTWPRTINHLLILGFQGSYMKEAVGLNQYINTCVPDTILASLHILAIKYLHIMALLRSENFFRVLLKTLNSEKYNYARALWIRGLCGDNSNNLDCFSNIKDHFPIIDKLVCAKVDYHQETPEYHPIYEKLSKFRSFGDLRVFGNISDPSFLLVHRDVYNPRYDPCMTHPPPLTVIDDNKRMHPDPDTRSSTASYAPPSVFKPCHHAPATLINSHHIYIYSSGPRKYLDTLHQVFYTVRAPHHQ
ncbi:uncharacterized protein LOC113654818 isoform X2 [Tachysurus fulvidraco]|uniref:uncharacterized protein LOC113654818 isoform X2 n=1 Tax=Tachysurus fulvidraco TaxID=1234273 RepID=UPI001FF00264|nr:uncharacterized protein LOC113654818 isoform X2 [Tachysurus fulvidraco]